jgi:hypothetical protein
MSPCHVEGLGPCPTVTPCNVDWEGAAASHEAPQESHAWLGEFNKKLRKSDEFKQDLPQEKMDSFTTESHDTLVKSVEKLKIPVEILPIDEKFSMKLPAALFEGINEIGNLAVWKKENSISDEEYKKTVEKVPTDFILGYYKVRDAFVQDVMQDFFKSQSRDLYKTKADVMKEIWKVRRNPTCWTFLRSSMVPR